jgi:hypothetical protein
MTSAEQPGHRWRLCSATAAIGRAAAIGPVAADRVIAGVLAPGGDIERRTALPCWPRWFLA